MITKEDFITRTNEDEIFCLFDSIFQRIKENRKNRVSVIEEIIIPDSELRTVIKQMLRDYDNQIRDDKQ